MADLTRDELAEMRKWCGEEPGWNKSITLGASQLSRLIDMASRCVSEETMKTLARARHEAKRFMANEETLYQRTDSAYRDFYIATLRDLKEAAEARAREGR